MSRPSSIYRPRNSTIHRRRSHNVYQDLFPLLDFKEISICLQSCEFTATEELVSRPSSQYIQSLTEQLLDTFMGISPERMEQMMNAVVTPAKENSNQEDDTLNSLATVMLYRQASEFYQMCGIGDFSLMDLMRPEPQRTRRILSAVVNFARFREENSVDCEELVTISENNLERVKKIEDDNTNLTNKIQELKDRLNGEEMQKASLKQINSYNGKLETELKRLKRNQEVLTFEHSQYKNEKLRLIEKLEDNNYLIIESSKELEKLKDYNQIDPELLVKIVDELKSNLQQYQSDFHELESHFRNMSITIESFQLVEQDLKNLFRILEEIMNDITREDEVFDRLTKYQEFLDQQRLESNDFIRQIQQIKRQLSSTGEKINRLRKQAEERSDQSKIKLAELKSDYDKLVEDRNDKEKELEKRKELINDLEHKIHIKRNQFQLEVKNSELAVARLNSHLKLYLTEMNKKV